MKQSELARALGVFLIIVITALLFHKRLTSKWNATDHGKISKPLHYISCDSGTKVIDNAAKTTFRSCEFEHYTLLRHNCMGNFNVCLVVYTSHQMHPFPNTAF